MKLSVIIPASKTCEIHALKSLKTQKEKILEVIVVRGKNTSKNRNDGIKKSKGDIVAFVNAHSILPKNWSLEILSFFKKYSKIDIVGGPQLTSKKESFFGQASGIALSSIFGAGNVSKRYGGKNQILNAKETDVTTANLSCRKKVFAKVKFDEEIYPGEDPKFIRDAKSFNFNVAYTPKIISYNKRRENFIELSKQIFNYGMTRPMKENFFQTLKHPLFFAPSVFLISVFVSTLLSIFYSINFIFFIDLYLILNLSFSLYESFKSGKLIYFIILPWIFITIHTSYGIGIFRGYLVRIGK